MGASGGGGRRHDLPAVATLPREMCCGLP
ncbi:hypothetical protein E2C01_094316 [Portunus trituberculatus]|uniref:Uncharacterized protein n=1 Tax=Portunus trituberculatus TaxID=210409 RepID=A0A5B7JVU0_PORTR|nr:hypothetical protein [Portunus trituberculatus]